ncbi:MAG: ferrous iron transport protein B [Clostridia bacterium]|nr:ferrous iron transport protein B [Clostridia bacterium]
MMKNKLSKIINLCYKSSKSSSASKNAPQKTVAFAGNPNVGKSSIFNRLTGLKQHTGNWPGKTVANARGEFYYKNKKFTLVDLPGTYSLLASSVEEGIARDFICFGNSDVVVIIVDSTCLERNLNLVLQIKEVAANTVICVNILDEAKRKGIHIDLDELAAQIDAPVVGTSASTGEGIKKLIEKIHDVSFDAQKYNKIKINYPDYIEDAIKRLKPLVEQSAKGKIDPRWLSLKLLDLESDKSLHHSLNTYLGFDILTNKNIANELHKIKNHLMSLGINEENLKDKVVSSIIKKAETIYNKCVKLDKEDYNSRDRKLDQILTSKLTGIPIMIALLFFIFWLTMVGANYPSELIANGLFYIQDQLTILFNNAGAPSWLHGILVLGIYRTAAWVVSVMLPPMAIFFPLFTILEDLGYLPRVAFNLDNYFRKANAHGKQALTMCMGFGCNACGVIGCRIIDSPRERLIATITNNFVPCNGRFPTLIAIITMFFSGLVAKEYTPLFSTILLTMTILIGIFATFLVSKILSKTILKGIHSSFTLELPPYRKPQIGKVIVRSIFDRTLFVLGRAVLVSAPAGFMIWLISNLKIGDLSILHYCTNFLDPFARLFGLDGVILMAFILGFPANEIVLPIIIMSYLCTGNLTDISSLDGLKVLLISHGWTYTTAICTMLFSLMHFPCGTTLLTIKKETNSAKWTFISFLIPTITGFVVCFALNLIINIVLFLR